MTSQEERIAELERDLEREKQHVDRLARGGRWACSQADHWREEYYKAQERNAKERLEERRLIVEYIRDIARKSGDDGAFHALARLIEIGAHTDPKDIEK